MSLDPRILERFEFEFRSSKQREQDAQNRVDVLQAELTTWQAQVTDEQGIQTAINSTLGQLGVAPIT